MTEQCKNPGAFKYVWPGKKEEAFICTSCVEKLFSVANAMGLALPVGFVSEDEKKQCQQQVEAASKEEGK